MEEAEREEKILSPMLDGGTTQKDKNDLSYCHRVLSSTMKVGMVMVTYHAALNGQGVCGAEANLSGL